VAWDLVLSPGRPRHEYDEGLMYALKAVELAPRDGNLYNSLALAEYRVGHWTESIAANERSMALRNGGDGGDWFFLAMAHWQKGEKDEARKWFDKAVAWTKEKGPKNAELRQFWTEAAELLGQPGPDAPGPGSPVAPSTEKSR
jgi:tetratricopeptide (TPR) repeat protein